MSEDLGKQVELQAQLNKLLQDRIKLQNQLNSACGQQAGCAQQMNEAAEKATANQEKQAKGQQKITQEQEKARKSQEKSGKTADGFFSKITTGQAAATGGVMGLVKGFKDMGFSLSGMGKLIKSFVSGLFSIGVAIIKMPFKIFSGLVGMANNMAQAGVALRQAYEDVRKEFGSFAEGPAKNVIAGFKDMTKSANNLGGTGLSVSKVYGWGPDGMAAMLKDVADIAKGLGSAMNLLGDEFGKVAQKAAMFKKGMGLSGEQMGKLMKDAKLSGKSQTEMMTEVGSMSLQMAKKFGLSSKDIARDIADMKGDFVTFGNVSTTQMGAASAYARKLGMTMKDLKGVVDKFDNFEGAADSVSQLNQAFGIQLDTMKMMNAENPAERIDMLRESFFAAGKSIENMTRQEKKLLQQQTGLTESALKNAFAAENQGIAYEDFADAAADSEEAQMSEKEVMLKLAEAIEKITKTGPQFTGIFDAFFKGFGKGMAYQKDFRALLSTIRSFLFVVYDFGKKIGGVFADILAETGLLGGLQDLFDPGALKIFLDDIMKTVCKLKAWLIDGTGNPDEILQEFTDKFANFFSDKKKALGKTGGALKRMGLLFSKLFGAVTGWLWKKLAPLFTSMFEKVGAYLSKNWKPIAMFVAKYVMAPLLIWAVMKGFVFAAGAGLAKMLAAKFLGIKAAAAAASKAGSTGAAAAASSGGLAAWLQSLAMMPKGTIGKAAQTLIALAAVFSVGVVMFAGAFWAAGKLLRKVSWNTMAKVLVMVAASMVATAGLITAALILDAMKSQMGQAIIGLLAAAAVFSIGMIAYAGGIWVVNKILSKVPMMQFLKQLGVIVLCMAITGLAIIAAALLVADGGTTAGLALLGTLAAALLFNVGMVAFAGGIWVVSKILAKVDLGRFLKQLGTIVLAMAATGLMIAGGAAIGMMGPALLLAGAGIVAAAALFTGGMLAFAGGIAIVMAAINKISGFDKFPSKLKVVGLAMLATVGLLGMAAVGVLAGLAYPLIIAGLTASAALFTGGMLLFAGAIATVDRKFKMKKGFEKKLDIVQDVINMTAEMLKIAGKMGLTALLGFGGPSIDSGAAFFIESGPKLFEMVKSIDKIKIPDPKKTAAVVGIVKDLIMAMSALKSLVPEQGVFSSIATMLSGGSPKALVSEMGTFITSILDKLQECVKGFVKLAQGMSKSDLEKGKVVASMIKAIADVAAAMAPTLKLISEDASYATTMKLLSAGTVTHKTGTAMEGMTVFFDKLIEKMPPLITALVEVMTKAMKGKDPKKVSAQADVLGKIMSSVKDVMAAVGEFQKMVGKQDGWLTSTKGAMKEVEKMFDLVAKLVGPGGAINKMITAMIELANQLVKLNTIKPEDMKNQIKVLETIAGDVLPNLGNAMQKMSEIEFPDLTEKTGFLGGGTSVKDQILNAFDQMATLITDGNKKLTSISSISAPFDTLKDAMSGLESIAKGFDNDYFGSSGTVVKAAQGLVESYNATYAALSTLTQAPMDLDIKLQTFADAMGMDSSTFTIDNEKLNFTVNVNVTMDAEKLSDTLTDKPTMGKKTMKLAAGG